MNVLTIAKKKQGRTSGKRVNEGAMRKWQDDDDAMGVDAAAQIN